MISVSSAAGPDHQNLRHELAQLNAGKIDWDWMERRRFARSTAEQGPARASDPVVQSACYCSSRFTGCPTKACASAGSQPYFQFFTGEEFFQHEFPHERSDLSHWRKRLGGKLELLLAGELAGWRMPAGHCAGRQDLKRVTVDTTVRKSPKTSASRPMPSCCTPPSKGLNRLANKHGVRLRQSYVRVGPGTRAMMAGRYAFTPSNSTVTAGNCGSCAAGSDG